MANNWKKLNMNEYVKVLPNDKGKEAFIQEWSITKSREDAEAYFKSKLDKDGYMTIQLWCAFEYFGSSMCAGMGGLHANEFYIDANTLKD